MIRSEEDVCARARQWVSARHDGEAGLREPELEGHLLDCPSCAAFLQGLDRIEPLFAEVRASAPGPGLFARIERDLPRSGRRSRVLPGVLAALAASVGFLAVFALARRTAAPAGSDAERASLFVRASRALTIPGEVALPGRTLLDHLNPGSEEL